VQYIINAAFAASNKGKPLLTVDGVYGPATQRQVQVWQYLTKVNDEQSAVVGPRTWATFGQYDNRMHRFDNEPVLKFNDVGHPSAVRDLQKALNTVVVPGKTPVSVDGSFGPRTLNALVQYQRNRSMPPSGEADRQTWTNLGILVTQRGH
jgi:peptidoglycan hydrolase-like protein with peptidoglycan-binding domain